MKCPKCNSENLAYVVAGTVYFSVKNGEYVDGDIDGIGEVKCLDCNEVFYEEGEEYLKRDLPAEIIPIPTKD